ncbi:MAG: metallophosphoesterase, partial [Burkholderiaceae bacterium]
VLQQSLIRKLPTNLQGKDFVVGDVHGCVDLLLRLLGEVKFDPDHDRLFAVGDLIDRGPYSMESLILSASPWFYSVQGNHEAMMLHFFSSYLQSGQLENLDDVNQTGFLDYGGDWVTQYFLADQKAMTPEFNQGLLLALGMPLMWVVGEGQDRFHVIHAELFNPSMRHSNEPIWLDRDIDQWLKNQTIPEAVTDCLYWSRAIAGKAQRSRVPASHSGLSPTFCGHSYDVQPRRSLSHICIDTGAFLTQWSAEERSDEDKGRYSLTLFDVKESSFVSASYQSDEYVKGDFQIR